MIRIDWRIVLICALITLFAYGIGEVWGEPPERPEPQPTKDFCDQYPDIQGCKKQLENTKDYPKVDDPILDGLNRMCDTPNVVWLWSDKESACVNIRNGAKKFGKYAQ